MRISKRQLNDVVVVTQSGSVLGRVVDFEIDVDTHQVVTYYVRGGDLLKELLTKDAALYISASQVISISVDKMVVEDTAQKVSRPHYRTAPAN